MKRTKLSERALPRYTPGEEFVNALSHGAGALMGAIATVLCVLRAASRGNGWGIVSAVIYGVSLMALFSISCVYHAWKPGMAKKVLQVVDHCTIYLLIAGSYTAVVLSALRPAYPALGWGLFGFEWGLAALAAVLTAIDLKKYSRFSMVCYIGMGWAVIPFWRQIYEVLSPAGFWLLLGGGIAYSIGAIAYGIGKRRRWMHSVFHLFVVLGALLQFLSIYGYAL